MALAATSLTRTRVHVNPDDTVIDCPDECYGRVEGFLGDTRRLHSLAWLFSALDIQSNFFIYTPSGIEPIYENNTAISAKMTPRLFVLQLKYQR